MISTQKVYVKCLHGQCDTVIVETPICSIGASHCARVGASAITARPRRLHSASTTWQQISRGRPSLGGWSDSVKLTHLLIDVIGGRELPLTFQSGHDPTGLVG